MNIEKLIPWKIKITSLYWVKAEEKLDKDLSYIFGEIDEDRYKSARILLDWLYNRWDDDLKSAPKDFVKKFYGETSKATAMLDFLEPTLVE